FTPGSRLDSWMYRILQNLWIDFCRARRARPEVGVDPEDLAALVVGDAVKDVEARSSLASVRQQVAALPEEQRAVLMLVSVEGASYKAAAEILELPIGTVMSRLARARIALGRALESGAAAPRQARG
ncbi:MAG: RNA polymerase sigma factor, partial [Dongiaceae bacterium]